MRVQILQILNPFIILLLFLFGVLFIIIVVLLAFLQIADINGLLGISTL